MTDARKASPRLPPRRPSPGPDPRKHLIAEYKHRLQEVWCICGWTGSSASVNGRTSDWSRHVAASRETS